MNVTKVAESSGGYPWTDESCPSKICVYEVHAVIRIDIDTVGMMSHQFQELIFDPPPYLEF